MLYENLSNKFKDQLVTVRKAKNLNNLILLLHDIDTNMKKIRKQFQLRVKSNAFNFPANKSPFKSYNSALTKSSTAFGVSVVSPVFSTATGTHLGPMDVFNVIRQGPILQEKKNRRNSLGLCYYFGEPGYIAIDYKNHTLLATKRQAAGTLTSGFGSL